MGHQSHNNSCKLKPQKNQIRVKKIQKTTVLIFWGAGAGRMDEGQREMYST